MESLSLILYKLLLVMSPSIPKRFSFCFFRLSFSIAISFMATATLILGYSLLEL